MASPRRRIWHGRAAALALALGGCAAEAPPPAPAPEVPEAWRNAAPVEQALVLPQPASRWWTAFGSGELDRLEDLALANNHDLQAAVRRLAQTMALADVSAAPLGPSVGATAKGSNTGPTGGVNAGAVDVNGYGQRTFQGGLTASYEFDVWGKNRAAADAALATVRASRFDRESVSATLVADVATTYFLVLSLDDRLVVARRNANSARTTLAALREKRRIGDGTIIELLQQQTATANAEAAVPALAVQRDRAADRLATLVGRAPAALDLASGSLDGVAVPAVAAGLPSDLLRRRPDIRKAEASLAAAHYSIHVARTKALPSFSLTGERGVGGGALSGLFASPTHLYYSLIGSVTATVFDNGKSAGDTAYSQARYDELVADYRKAVLAALADVEDGLSAVRWLTVQETAQAEAALRSGEAYGFSQIAYHAGILDYPTLLETERTKFQAEDAAIQVRVARLGAAVALFKALGGAMDPDARPPDPDPDSPVVSPATAPLPASVPPPDGPA